MAEELLELVEDQLLHNSNIHPHTLKQFVERFKEIRAERNDAQCILNGLGYDGQACNKCKRNTMTKGYVCWNCGHDKSADEED